MKDNKFANALRQYNALHYPNSIDNANNYKLLQEFQFGDLIEIKAPFEENTKDYYFGYDVKSVRGELVKDNFGRTSKRRSVMVIAVNNNELTYIPLTSQHGSKEDNKHHYKCKNIIKTQEYKNYDTYIELNSIRTVTLNNNDRILHYGVLPNNDKQNLLGLLIQRCDKYSKNKDCRRFATKKQAKKIKKYISI